MNHSQPSRACVLGLLPGWMICLASIAAAQGTTTLTSATPSGVAGNQSADWVSLSRDGRFVAFESWATDLVPNDTNGFQDVFVRDRLLGQTRRVSVDSAGNPSDSISSFPMVSGNGSCVAFTSFSNLLVPGDTNGVYDAFVHDLVNGQTTRVSVDSNGAQSDGGVFHVSISLDGRFVAFDTTATNLIAGDTNQAADIYVHDRLTGQTVRASVATNGTQADGSSQTPAISADGRFVCFASAATNLVPNDSNNRDDIFVHDMLTGVTERVSVSSAGAQGTGMSMLPSISADGRWVTFDSTSHNISVEVSDGNHNYDVFLHDRMSGQTTMVSVTPTGVPGNHDSNRSAISADGRYVAFGSIASTLVNPPPPAVFNVFVRDLALGQTTLVSVNSAGTPANDSSLSAAISGDGRVIAFESRGTNLDPGDTSSIQDVYAHERSVLPHVRFCFGDGSGSACPCGNASAAPSQSGCQNSLGIGAGLSGSGTASIAADTLVLFGSSMPDSSVLYFQGTTRVANGAGSVFGDGLRCAGGQAVRLGAKLNVAGTSQYPAAGDAPLSVKGQCQAGDVRTYQCWYRNAAAFCTPSTFNLTNGVEVHWQS